MKSELTRDRLTGKMWMDLKKFSFQKLTKS